MNHTKFNELQFQLESILWILNTFTEVKKRLGIKYSKTSLSRTPLSWILVKLHTFMDAHKSCLFWMCIQVPQEVNDTTRTCIQNKDDCAFLLTGCTACLFLNVYPDSVSCITVAQHSCQVFLIWFCLPWPPKPRQPLLKLLIYVCVREAERYRAPSARGQAVPRSWYGRT